MNTPEVVMMGPGYIGLPTAALIAEGRTKVHRVDSNQNVIDTINRGEIHIVQKILQNANNEDYYIVEPNISEHNFFKRTNYKYAYKIADIIVYLVSHDEFKGLPNDSDKVILDFCGVNNL